MCCLQHVFTIFHFSNPEFLNFTIYFYFLGLNLDLPTYRSTISEPEQKAWGKIGKIEDIWCDFYVQGRNHEENFVATSVESLPCPSP